MNRNLLDFIDFEKVNSLLDGFNTSTGFVTAIIDHKGNILSKSGWREICNNFHRVNPETAKNCRISDTELANKFANGEHYHFYKCLNGLVDVAVPIIINGEHIANLFSGQFFFENPDRDLFKEKAKQFGFDDKKYLEALDNVPVVSKEKVIQVMDFLHNTTQLIFEVSFQKMEQADLYRALKESELQYRNLANAGSALIWTSGVDKLCNYFNQTWLNFTGRSLEQEKGNGWVEGVHPDDLDRCFETYVTAFDKHEPFEMEYRLRHVSGEYRIILDLGTPNFDNNGEFIGYIGHCFDITERKKAEEQIRFQADIIDNSPVIAAYHDKELNMVWANRAYQEATGLSLEQIKGKKCYQIWNLSKPCQGCPVITAIETGENASHELTPDNQDHWPDNQGYWLSQAAPVRDKEGAVIGAVEFALNITERKLLEKSIRESEKQFRQLVDNAPQGIFVQTDGLFAYINPIATKLFGAKNYVELVGTSVIERFHPNYRELVKQRINQLNNEKKNVPLIEEVCLKIDGTPFDTEVSAAPINYLGKNGALVFFQDITERKKANNELLALKSDLEVKVKEKTKELNERVAELERFHDATIDREIRMKELRDEINRLKGL
jgi:PAS domain S-box-containing protein